MAEKRGNSDRRGTCIVHWQHWVSVELAELEAGCTQQSRSGQQLFGSQRVSEQQSGLYCSKALPEATKQAKNSSIKFKHSIAAR